MSDLVMNEDGTVDVVATLKLSLPEAHDATIAQQRLLDAVDHADETARHAAILRELEAALHVVAVVLPLATGLGILPTAVGALGPPVVEAIDRLLEGIKGK